MAVNKSTTGNIRVRLHKQMFKDPVFVLQVEEREVGHFIYNVGGRVESDDIDRTYYRDADARDIDILAGLLK